LVLLINVYMTEIPKTRIDTVDRFPRSNNFLQAFMGLIEVFNGTACELDQCRTGKQRRKIPCSIGSS